MIFLFLFFHAVKRKKKRLSLSRGCGAYREWYICECVRGVAVNADRLHQALPLPAQSAMSAIQQDEPNAMQLPSYSWPTTFNFCMAERSANDIAKKHL